MPLAGQGFRVGEPTLRIALTSTILLAFQADGGHGRSLPALRPTTPRCFGPTRFSSTLTPVPMPSCKRRRCRTASADAGAEWYAEHREQQHEDAKLRWHGVDFPVAGQRTTGKNGRPARGGASEQLIHSVCPAVCRSWFGETTNGGGGGGQQLVLGESKGSANGSAGLRLLSYAPNESAIANNGRPQRVGEDRPHRLVGCEAGGDWRAPCP